MEHFELKDLRFQESRNCIFVDDIRPSEKCKRLKFVSTNDRKMLDVLNKFPAVEEAVMRFDRCETLVGTVINLTNFHNIRKFKIASNFYKDM